MKLKLRPILKDISLTFIAEGIVFIAFFFIYKLVAENFGPEGVGEYSLVKKVISFLQPILLLGLIMGLPRYIAMSRDKDQRNTYMKSGVFVVATFTFIFLIFINIFKDFFAKIFFGTADYINLVLPLSFFLAGLILHTLAYSYFRGRLFVKTFNLLQMMNLALIPLIILLFFKNITIEKFVTLIGISTFIIAFLFSLFFIKDFFKVKKQKFKQSLKELLSYSLPRVPGSFALVSLFSLGPIFAAHFASIQEVGYLSVSQSLMAGIGSAVAPLGLILLPKVSNLIANGREEIIKKNLNFLIEATLQLSIFISIQIIIFTEAIIKYWLGSEFLGAIPVLQIISLSIIFYIFFVAMRDVIDAAKFKPINTINLFMSLGVFLFVAGILLFFVKILSFILSLAIASTLGMVSLGILTYISIRKIYPENPLKDLKYLFIAILVNILLGVVAISLKPLIISEFYYLILFEGILGIFYLSILWLLKMEWIRQIPKKVFQ